MKLKRRSKAIGDFSMASMTDVIFLLLIFFMVSSTLVVPSRRNGARTVSARSRRSVRLPRLSVRLRSPVRWQVLWGMLRMPPDQEPLRPAPPQAMRARRQAM